jgi:hypothetical protein
MLGLIVWVKKFTPDGGAGTGGGFALTVGISGGANEITIANTSNIDKSFLLFLFIDSSCCLQKFV